MVVKEKLSSGSVMLPVIGPTGLQFTCEDTAPPMHEGNSSDVDNWQVEEDVLYEGFPVQSHSGEDSINRDEEGQEVGKVPAEVDEPLPAVFSVTPEGPHVEEEMDAPGVDL